MRQAEKRRLRGGGRQTKVSGMKHLRILGLLVGVTGCGLVDRLGAPDPVPVAAAPNAEVAPLVVAGQTAAALDSTTAAEKAAAVAQPAAASEADLGLMVVALGSPAEQGFWLKSDKIAAPGKGRVVTAGGGSVAVDLQPGSGAALLSLAAFRALGLGLTDLPQVRVFAN